MENLKFLLKEIKELNQKNNDLNQREARGFNIFSLLLKSGDEVNLHSKFIYELLNPNGSHQQGSLFLDLFFKELNLEMTDEKISVFREKYYIDILLQSSNYAFIIENKIYTEDHSFQLSRYVNTMKNVGYKEENILVIYLTLFGNVPREQKVNAKVITMSYGKEIVSWLKQAIHAVSDIGILSETLKQYLSLVERLTHQLNNQGAIESMKNLLLEGNNLQTIIELEPSIIETKMEIQFSFWQTLLSQLIPHYAFTFYNTNNDKGLKNSIRRYYQLQKNIKDYGIKYEIEENVYFFIELRNNIYYGFEFIDEDMIEEEQREAIGELDISWNEVSSSIYWKYPEKQLDFKNFNHQNIFDLIDSENRENDIKKISDEIITLINNYRGGLKYVA